MTVRIIENYRGWQPPFNAGEVVEALLDRHVMPRLWACLPASFWVAMVTVVYRAARLVRRSWQR